MNKNLKYFILTILAPTLGIIFVFSYAYFYVQNEINATKYEIVGLKKINQVQDIIFDIQVLRGLSNIKNGTNNHKFDIDKTRGKISQLKKDLQLIPDQYLQKESVKILEELETHTYYYVDFDILSNLIKETMLFIEDIAYSSGLVLDSNKKAYILVKTITKLLPELVEYNGQIRGISSSVRDGSLSSEQKQYIIIQLSKIEQKLAELNLVVLKMNSIDNTIKPIYNTMLKAQDELIKFAQEEILEKDKISISGTDIFKQKTKNIKMIISLYNTNSNELKNILEQKLKDRKKLAFFIILIAIGSILFIVYVNFIFFKKNKKFIAKIEELTITDEMTKIYNRRHFDNIFHTKLKTKNRIDEDNLILVIIDIDYFKQYNDTYGHQAGDNALLSVASSLKSSLRRSSDMVFRLGGEEFGLLFNSKSEEKALYFANKIRTNINNLYIEHKNSKVDKYLTVSMGLILIKVDSKQEMDVLYKKVDQALYEAKENGRNQVVIYKDTI